MVLRWFLDGTRIAQPAVDNSIGKTTAYDYLNDAVDLLAEQAPSLNAALLAAKAAGHHHISIDGSVFDTTRCSEAGPTLRKGSTTGRRVDLWWSGKHHHHGGNIQVITAPDGWPLWTSPVRPGREHDTLALRAHAELLPALELWTGDGLPVLADLGYEGEAATITTATKTPAGGTLTDDRKTANKTHNGKRTVGERGNALLKRNIPGGPTASKKRSAPSSPET